MAEAKKTTKKTTSTKSTSTTKNASTTSTSSSTGSSKKDNQWKDVLEATRTSYMSSLKSLTKLQEETEKLISNLAQKGKSLQEDNIKIIKDWIESGVKLRDNFKNIFENSYQKVLSIFEGLNLGDVNFPLKGQFEDMMKKMEENMKKYFSFLKF